MGAKLLLEQYNECGHEVYLKSFFAICISNIEVKLKELIKIHNLKLQSPDYFNSYCIRNKKKLMLTFYNEKVKAKKNIEMYQLDEKITIISTIMKLEKEEVIEHKFHDIAKINSKISQTTDFFISIIIDITGDDTFLKEVKIENKQVSELFGISVVSEDVDSMKQAFTKLLSRRQKVIHENFNIVEKVNEDELVKSMEVYEYILLFLDEKIKELSD